MRVEGDGCSKYFQSHYTQGKPDGVWPARAPHCATPLARSASERPAFTLPTRRLWNGKAQDGVPDAEIGGVRRKDDGGVNGIGFVIRNDSKLQRAAGKRLSP